MSIFDQIKKNTFVINILSLISGTAISQGILFAATPLLTRIFTPDDFGVFSIYAAIVAVVASVSSWKYELAIMLPEKEKDVQSLFVLSILATFITSLFVLILILILKPFLASYVTDDINTFIWIVPLGILFSGWFQVLISFGTKKKIFTKIAISRVTQATGGVGSQSAIGGFKLFPLGLIWGKLFGDILACIYLIIVQIKKQYIHLKLVSREGIKINAQRYRDFPKYQSFAQFLSSLSQNVPYLMLSSLYGVDVAGFYMLTARVLHVPTTLIARSTKEVYYQRAAELFSQGKSIHKLFKKTTFGLFKLGILPFITFAIFAVPVFTFVFGNQWESSGLYAQIIIAWTFFGFINPPSTASIYILGLQRFSLKYELTLVITRILVIYLSYLWFNDHYITIICLTLIGVLFNSFLISYCFRKTKTITKT